MSKKISCEHSDEQAALLEAEAKRRNVTVSDVLRWAVDGYFNGDVKKNQNMNTLLYEIVKTQAFVVRASEGAMLTEEECIEAGKDAEVYLAALKTKAA